LETRSSEREREPTDHELERLYAYWRANARQRIDMTTICSFALATGMRLGELADRAGLDGAIPRGRMTLRADRGSMEASNTAGKH
jgi:integrase